VAKKNEISFENKKKEWQDSLVPRFLKAIDQSGCKAVAIGLDMAAQEENWGLSMISLDEDFCSGQLTLILPHRASIDGYKAHCPLKPSKYYLRGILEGLRDRDIETALAVDVPLGWPIKHGLFTHDWSALNRCAIDMIPLRDEFEFRQTDLLLREMLRNSDSSAALFAVGADKIACASFEWAKIRANFSGIIQVCDVGLDNVLQSSVILFETYPAAFVRLNFPDCISYKSGEKTSGQTGLSRSAKEIRYELVDKLLAGYRLDIDSCRPYIDQACSSFSSDAFDGFLSAITAWDYLRWRKYGDDSHFTTTPKALLRRDPTIDESNTIEKEGWILIRKSELKDVSLLQSTSESWGMNTQT
jgi:hypothetical protein